MSHSSTPFPKPPSPRPLGSARQRLVSNLLIFGGAFLLLMGSWQLYQYQQSAVPPPSAPIIDSVSAFSTAETLTPTAMPTATPTTAPTATHASERTQPSPTATMTVTPSPATIQPVLKANSDEVLPDIDFSFDGNLSIHNLLDLPVDTPTVSAPITRIVAEDIGMDTEVVEVGWQNWTDEHGNKRTLWQVASYAAGWHRDSALPGYGGNIVLSGHHNTDGEVFREIIDLEVDSVITIYEGEQAHDYHVVEKFIVKDLGEPIEVRRANAKWIGPFDEERLTLVTCWPYVGNTHRSIVIAKPVVGEEVVTE
ncbi:sortase [Anaerolineales bacterium HSG6]|nr:sortase [Anaerolineales bacterium HSG6]